MTFVAYDSGKSWETSRLVRSLVVVQVPPYPPMGGVALRNWQTISLLAQYGPVAVFSIYKGPGGQGDLPGVEFWQHCDLYQAKRSFFSKIQCRLQNLRPQGHPYVDWVYRDGVAQRLQDCLHQLQPEVVVFEEVWLYRYLATVQRYGCLTVLDNHNLEGDKEVYRQDTNASRKLQIQVHIRLRQIRSVEAAFIRQVTQTWLCSAEDQSLMQQCYGDRQNTWIIPNGVDVDFYHGVRQGDIAPPDRLQQQVYRVLFLAKFSYGPNQEATEILIREIYPVLRQRYPDCEVLLVGREPTSLMQQAAKENPRIVVTGQVPDVRPYLAAAQVMVVPLRQGGGTRLKILEAFAADCSVVSTAKGAEGIAVEDNQHLLLRESADDLAAGVITLWEDVAFRSRLAAAAWELVNSRYSREGVGQRLRDAIAELSSIEKA